MAIDKNQFTRKAAESAPGEVFAKTGDAKPKKGRNSTKTVVKSFSVRADLCERLEAHLWDIHERSASKIVNEALEAYLDEHAKNV